MSNIQHFAHTRLSLLPVMVKKSPLSHYFELKQRLLDNKAFLVQLASTKSEKSCQKLIQKASSVHLQILCDLIKNIADRNIEIEKSIFYQLENKKLVLVLVKVLKKFQKQPDIYRRKNQLRQFLLGTSKLLPYLIKTILKQNG